MTTVDLLKDVNLRYSTDKKPGFTRRMIGKKFKYFDLDGKLIKDKKTIERINKLAIPPAYKNVWICPYPNGHLQATGVDSRGHKQYHYHPLWTELAQQKKFTHLIDFARHLPKIRRKIKKGLALSGMPRTKVLASVVWLLENTLIRVGNEEYEKENKSYGLTTLKNKHADVVKNHKIILHFKGKSGVQHKVDIHNKKVANIVRRCRELPGQDLFEYVDDEGQAQSISSYDVNNYLKEITGENITAKDFRTWGGTILAATVLDKAGVGNDEKVSKKSMVDTIKRVARHLRNKPNTCKKYYIHPSILDAYSAGYVLSNIDQSMKSKKAKNIKGLDACENKVVAMLEYMITKEKRKILSAQVAI